MANARKALKTADDGYDEALEKAIGQWNKQKDAGITDKKFWEWTQHNVNYLRIATEGQKKAQTTFDSASQRYYGPQAAVLADYRNHIRDAMITDPDKKFAGYVVSMI